MAVHRRMGEFKSRHGKRVFVTHFRPDVGVMVLADQAPVTEVNQPVTRIGEIAGPAGGCGRKRANERTGQNSESGRHDGTRA